MSCVEAAIDKSGYVHTTKRLLSWLQAMDQFAASGNPCLTLVEATMIAVPSGVQASAVPALSGFRHETGNLLWLDDKRLLDTVVLIAVTFFITPATRIICKKLSTSADSTRCCATVARYVI
jgi:hypothetical protein